MKKNIVFTTTLAVTLLVFFGISQTIYAFDWAKYDIQVENEVETEKNVQLSLTDNRGNSFDITYFGKEPDDKTMENIHSLYVKFYKWKYIRIKKIDFTIQNNQLNILVIPEEYIYKKLNLLRHLPAGMLFSFKKRLSYNFRIESKNIFARVKNRYLDEDRLSRNIYSAVRNPMLYIEKHDPYYFYRQLERLRGEYTKLREEHDKLTYGIIFLQNEGVMSSKIDKDMIQRIVQIKKDTPEITNDQLKDQLEKEGLDVSTKVLHIVLSLYYNDFK